MKLYVPEYYPAFRCVAGRCRHTCCAGWEVAVDEASLSRFLRMPDVAPHVDTEGGAHLRLLPGECCPFLNEEGLCRMILRHGEDVLCDICRDHPRFRSFWSDRVEMGLGLVCEEAGRLILGRRRPFGMILWKDDGTPGEAMGEAERALYRLRGGMLRQGPDFLPEREELRSPAARLWEYLTFRHLPDSLYDARVEERRAFVAAAYRELTDLWAGSGGTLPELVEICRQWSYDVEYDDEELQRRLCAFSLTEQVP